MLQIGDWGLLNADFPPGSLADKHFASPGIGNGSGFKTGFAKERQPALAGENAEDVRVVNHTDRFILLPQQVGKVDCVGCVARLRIKRPLDIADRTSVAGLAVVAPVSGERYERFPDDIGHE